VSLVTARLALLGERPKPGSRYLPELIGQIWNRRINPGRVFDLTLPLDEVAERYRTMDERRAIETLLLPE
jgi:threonine dehydrogenase-like Zn-dependent dehydrogenase